MGLEQSSEKVTSIASNNQQKVPPYTPGVLPSTAAAAELEDKQQSDNDAETLLAGLDTTFQSKGKISFYGTPEDGFGYDKDKMITASGIKFNPHDLVAAHLGLPFGTVVEVTNATTGRSVRVRVVDRGPYVKDREFDLSYAAFKAIANPKKGIIDARFRIISKPDLA